MSSLFDGIFIKPLDKNCRDHHQYIVSFRLSLEFIMRNTIPAPRRFVKSTMASLTFDQHKPGCVWLFLTSRDTLVIVSRYLLRSSNPIFYLTPYHCCNEAWLWYSEYQQERWKHIANCFLINYPNTVAWVKSWIHSSPLYLKAFEFAVLSCISCSAFPWIGYTPKSCV
jgi:hypothetical protein